MNAPGRLAAYGLGLVLVFGGAYAVAGAVVPASTVTDWQQRAAGGQESNGEAGHAEDGGHGAESGHADSAPALRGLSIAQDGYQLGPVTAPAVAGTIGSLTFRILDDDGAPVTDFAVSHEKRLHLVVVRSDGTQFRHVHPTMRPDGTWTVPWTWRAAGSYRVFADFVPADFPSGDDAPDVTVSRTLDVAGDVVPRTAERVRRSDRIAGLDVRLSGDLRAGAESELTIDVTRAGRPVTALQPYLGAFGHLVALRAGDLGYLHVHAEGDEPGPGATAGPEIRFATTAPTAGRYLLYLDFRVDGVVRTATFVLEADR